MLMNRWGLNYFILFLVSLLELVVNTTSTYIMNASCIVFKWLVGIIVSYFLNSYVIGLF